MAHGLQQRSVSFLQRRKKGDAVRRDLYELGSYPFLFSVILHLASFILGSSSCETAILVRCSLGLYLGVDLSILIVIISQLVILKKSSGDLNMTITKLSWILCLLTFASTIMVVGELYVELPQPVRERKASP